MLFISPIDIFPISAHGIDHFASLPDRKFISDRWQLARRAWKDKYLQMYLALDCWKLFSMIADQFAWKKDDFVYFEHNLLVSEELFMFLSMLTSTNS